MRQTIIILLVLALNCGSHKSPLRDQSTELVNKYSYLTFEIGTSEKMITEFAAYEIMLRFKNVSGEKLLISKPNCMGVNIMPFLFTSDRKPMPMLFRIKPNCKEEKIELLPEVFHEETFPYDLKECFSLNKYETYTLEFKYLGNIYDTTGNKIADDEPLMSNTLQLEFN